MNTRLCFLLFANHVYNEYNKITNFSVTDSPILSPACCKHNLGIYMITPDYSLPQEKVK